MLVTIAAGALSALAFTQQIDTTVPVQTGQRLTVDAYGGQIDVTTWARNAVRVEAEPSGRASVEVTSSAAGVSVRTQGRRGPASSVELHISVPAWMALDLSGVYTDVTVSGTRSSISVETVQGDVDVTGGRGNVDVRSVQGHVTVKGAKGRIQANSVNEDVTVTDVSGDITAETVNGEIVLERVDATNLNATTINGDVGYDGPIRNGGRYSMSSHNGDLTLAIAPSANATVSVSTFNGEFESDFPVPVRETRKGRRFSFTLGSGSAQVSLDSFQGSIRLAQPVHRTTVRERD